MANTIGWGQGAVNNTIGWGKSATNNTIGYGEVCEDSWSPETNLVGGSAVYNNEYSYNFDGVDSYLASSSNFTTIDNATSWSISGWIYPTTTATRYFMSIGIGGTQRLALLYRGGSSARSLDFSLASGSYFARSSPQSVPQNQWSHFVWTWDGSLGRYDKYKLYVNGVLDLNGNAGSLLSQMGADNGNLNFGRLENNAFEWAGNIDEVGIWKNYVITESEALEIYNNGAPNNLNNFSTPPNSWFRMGENDTWNGREWTINDENSSQTLLSFNMAEDDRRTDVPVAFSNLQSVDLDGIDDYVEVLDADNLSFGDSVTDSAFTISAWVNMTDATTFRIVSKLDGTNFEYALFTTSTDLLYFYIYDANSLNRRGRYSTNAVTSYENQWIHICATYDGQGGNTAYNGMKVYLNGVRYDNTNLSVNSYTAMHNTNAPLEIGKYISTNANGLIDEVAVFNRELSQSQINQLYTNKNASRMYPVSYWRFEGTGTTATDSGSGGNNGTLTNGATRSTDVPT
jgi:hypothetical protein